MWDVLRLNPVAPVGLSRFPSERYRVVEACPNPDAILLRSHALAESEIPSSVLVVARAGAGVNNIPVALCSARGIPVFNTPGGNANAVKELVAAALLLASRDIVAGIRYVDSLSAIQDPAALTAEVEGNKRRFRGWRAGRQDLGRGGLGAPSAAWRPASAWPSAWKCAATTRTCRWRRRCGCLPTCAWSTT